MSRLDDAKWAVTCHMTRADNAKHGHLVDELLKTYENEIVDKLLDERDRALTNFMGHGYIDGLEKAVKLIQPAEPK